MARMENTARQREALLADKTGLADQLQVRGAGCLLVPITQQ
jgi:hypothetical protein